jgi:N-dimethylarginine dimethylaminohydrolase
MAAEQRAGEEPLVAATLAALGIPIVATIRGAGTFEGADAQWLDERTLLIGVGRRTNASAVEQLEPLLGGMGVRVVTCELSPRVQHLLGAVNPLDERLAAVVAPALGPSLRAALSGWELVELPGDDETFGRRGHNWVTVAPRRVVMPAGCPRTRATLEARGVTCIEVDVSEYVAADGAIGCATGVLERG